MIITHKIEIKPNESTKKQFNQYFGYSRYCYNRALDIWKKEYENGNKPNFRKVRDLAKKNKLDWEKNYTPIIIESTCEDLERGFKMMYKGYNKYPKFKSKKKSNDSFRINRKSDSTIRIINNKLFLPKFKYGIRLTELPRFNGTIKQCTITNKANKYYVSLTIDTDKTFNQTKNLRSIGIDLGIKTFAVLGYDSKDKSKRIYKSIKGIYKKLIPLYNKISYYQRLMSKKQYNSNKYSVMKTKLQRLYLRISNIQKDYLNKLSTKIIKSFQYITIEDLTISNMIKNRKLSKVISRSLFYTFRCMLEYKSKLYGNTLIIADKWYPSTQICSHCGYRKEGKDKLTLKDRTYICPECGIVEDRDENAAYNLKLYGERQVELQP